MASFVKFEQFVEEMGLETHDLNADTLKVMLSNTAPTVATDAVKTDITEIGAGNGYTAGGTAVGSNAYSQTSGIAKLTGDDVVFTASGGTIGPFRYVVLYNDTAALDELIGYWDYGSSVTLQDTETFTVDFDGVTGILTLE